MLCVRTEMAVVVMESVCKVSVSVTPDTLEHAVRQVSTNYYYCNENQLIF